MEHEIEHVFVRFMLNGCEPSALDCTFGSSLFSEIIKMELADQEQNDILALHEPKGADTGSSKLRP